MNTKSINFCLLACNNQGPLEADVVHTLKVRLKVVGGTEVRLELCCLVSILGSGRVLGRGTLLTKVSSIFALLVATVLGREEEGVV